MLTPRVIPCLLIHKKGLVKTVKFSDPKYVGDPINAVKIFNEKGVDELIILDISATVMNVEPDYEMIRNYAAESRMPLCYGGGIKTAEQAEKIISIGVEKIALSSVAISNPNIITSIADSIGSASISVVLDVKKNSFGFYEVWTHNGTQNTGLNPFETAQNLEALGIGEIIINSIDNDGVMQGYDISLAKQLSTSIGVPFTVLGGAGSLEDIEKLIKQIGIVGAAAGSLFVFKGPFRAVLINYPNLQEHKRITKACEESVDDGL